MEAFIGFDESLECTQSFPNGLQAWDWFCEHSNEIDVALLDIDMPGLNGIELARQIKSANPKVECLMCTIYEDNDRIFKALEAGASGYILKKSPASNILAAIKEIYAGGAPMSSEIARRVVQRFGPKTNRGEEFDLSSRETEILMHLEKGLLYKEIAAILNISLETVRRHVHNIYSKLHVNNRTEAINKFRN
jgi:DNA-binding NarL/FixJ family response regulator